MSALPPARARLRAAIVARSDVKGRLDAAKQSEHRGRTLLKDAETRLAAFGDVDAEIVQARASRFAASALAGGPPPEMTLPPSLIAKERRRDEAHGAVAAARAAHASLAADLEQSEKARARAEQAVATIAAELLVEEGIKIAARLRTTWAEIWRQQDELSALAGYWLPADGAGLRPVQLPPGVVGLMQSIAAFDHRQFPGGRNPSLGTAGAVWRRWYTALLADADADAQFDGDGEAPGEQRREVA